MRITTTLSIDYELKQKATQILKKKHLTLSGFLDMKMEELIKENERRLE